MRAATKIKIVLLGFGLGLMAGCSKPPPADQVFIGRHILTMDAQNPSAEGVAVAGGKIVFVGSAGGAEDYVGDATELIQLGDQALLPGFIDAHGHFTLSARLIDFVNLSPPPVGAVTDMASLILNLADFAGRQSDQDGWILGYGYDDSLIKERRHPTRDDLDRVSKDRPILLVHVSFHFVTVNSAALQALGINADSPNPEGGIIRRRPGSRAPNGVLEESAIYTAFQRITNIPPEKYETLLRKTAIHYASFGITTAQDGASSVQDLAFLREIAQNRRLPIDLQFYQRVRGTENPEDLAPEKDYSNGLRLAGAKFILDGSPQGRTAWLTQPYEITAIHKDQNYTAYSTVNEDLYREFVQKLLAHGIQFISHANGDAAIDLMLDALDQGLKAHPASDHRSVIIHAQLMRHDQVRRAQKLAAIPSYFSAHPFFWGDWHVLNFGERRASQISPTGWAMQAGLKFTLHNDAPVIPPDMMRLVWASVNRKTRSGRVLGAEQRLEVMEALRAITIDAAYQGFEEGRKGSISVGKQADLVILEQNPVLANKADLADIKVVRTLARGETIYGVMP